jgi:DNA polymerase I
MWDLPFKSIYVIDFEYRTAERLDGGYPIIDGARPLVVCLVAREIKTGNLIRLWYDELGSEPPFPVDDETLFVAYAASAEMDCFLGLGWPVPRYILDPYFEFRNETNGLSLPTGNDLLGALAYHGISTITKDQKKSMRDLVMRGGPWTPQEREDILDYCQSDVDPLVVLLERMLPRIRLPHKGLEQALLRGRYAAAVSSMQFTGIPIDVSTLDRLRRNWDLIKADLIKAIDADFGVYEGTKFKNGLFKSYLADQGIDWPVTATGLLKTDSDTFKEMAQSYPSLEPLRELKESLSALRKGSISVGPDGRNRTGLRPFGASTGRNTPSNSKFIFGSAAWLRGLIQPAEGRAVAYIDWSAQEVWIAAVLSGDDALLAALESGDPYLAFAKMAGLAPADATKESHEGVRGMAKTCVLGSNYGMGARSLALRTGHSVMQSTELLRRMRVTFPKYTAWSEGVIDRGQLNGYVRTVFGWVARTESMASNSVRNFPMQANGAEMLRLACCLATERGVEVCAPVHDALLIEADVDGIDAAVSATREAMAEASAVVLRGVRVPTDVEVFAYPQRYLDKRGVVMWETVNDLLPA